MDVEENGLVAPATPRTPLAVNGHEFKVRPDSVLLCLPSAAVQRQVQSRERGGRNQFGVLPSE